MTISTTTSRKTYTGNAVTRVFAVPFIFYDTSDVIVELLDPDTGLGTVQIESTDYSVTGGNGGTGSVTMTTAPASGVPVYIHRLTPYTQVTAFSDGEAMTAASLEAALDRITVLAQQAADAAEAAVRLRPDAVDPDTSADMSLPAPEADKLVAGKSDASGWENRAVNTFSGVPITTPVAVNNGGTGGTTAAAARTNLGLGTSATYDTGTTSGTIPVLQTGGLLAGATIPQVSSSAAGALPAWSTVTDGFFLSGTGWVSAGLIVPLLDSVLAADATTFDGKATGSEWNAYDEFIVDLFYYFAAANSGARAQMYISGTLRASSEYVWTMTGCDTTGLTYAGANPGSPSDNFRLNFTADNVGPYNSADMCWTRLRVANLYNTSTSYPIIVHGQSNSNDDGVTYAKSAVVYARNYANLGRFTGIRLLSEDATAIVAGSRIRICGIKNGVFPT